VIPNEKLQELAPLYEEFNYSIDPFAVKRAKLIFKNECQKLYQNESVEFRKQMTCEVYPSSVVIPAILDYLKPKQPFPTV
jgi:hypothetical protein